MVDLIADIGFNILQSIYKSQYLAQDAVIKNIKSHIITGKDDKLELKTITIKTPKGNLIIPELSMTHIPNMVIKDTEISFTVDKQDYLNGLDDNEKTTHVETDNVVVNSTLTDDNKIKVTVKYTRDNHPSGITSVLEGL